MQRTTKFYRFLCKIGFCKRNGRFDKDWDDKLNSLMEREKIVNINGFNVKFSSGEEVWISNHPYSSGHLQLSMHKLPSFNTLWKFEELVLNYIKEKGLQSKINNYR